MATSDRPLAPALLALEVAGRAAGTVLDARGGEALGEVVETVEADGTVSKHLGALRWSDLTLELAPDLDPALLDWLRSTLDRTYARKAGAVLVASFDGHVIRRTEFDAALMSEVRFPALDAASTEAARLIVKLAPEITRRSPGSGSVANPTGKRSKTWLASNFRLQIDGLDCSQVSKIDAITVRTVLAANPVGELREYEKAPVRLECSDLVVTLGEAVAETFLEWHERFVVQGRSEKAAEKSGQLELLDPTLQGGVLPPLELRGLGIHSLVSGRTSQGMRTVTASMYCHSVAFPAPPPAAESLAAEPLPADLPRRGDPVADELPPRLGRLQRPS